MTPGNISLRELFKFAKLSLSDIQYDFTTGSIRKAVFLLAIPMILEMCMESIFAVVDIFFVGKLGSNATATVGLTESALMIVYSIAIGISMAATAMVARRIGEKNYDEGAKAGAQAIMVAITIAVPELSILISCSTPFHSKDAAVPVPTIVPSAFTNGITSAVCVVP